jgi:hypothetical protein
MWQKERLLNLAIDLLPGNCRSVVWIDCDLVALRADWPAEAARVLEVYPVAQGFRHVWDLPHDASFDRFAAPIAGPRVTSYASQIATGAITVDALGGHRSREAGGGGTGYVWAARRELIQQHRLYDANIVGGGDKAFLCAVFGRFAANIDAQCMGPRRARHYVDWAGPLHDAVGGRVGFVDVDLVHLWHGDLGARGYGERHQRLADFDFDPLADLALDEGACWRWSSAKPAMHAWVRSYFESRKEDG